MSAENRGRFLFILILVLLAFQFAFVPIGLAPKDELTPIEQGTFEFRLGKPAYEEAAQREVVTRKLQSALEEAGVNLDPGKLELRDARTLHVETLAITDDERSADEILLLATLRTDYPGTQVVDIRREDESVREPVLTVGPLALYKPAPQLELGLDLRGGQHLVLECRPETVLAFSTPPEKPMFVHEGGLVEYFPGGEAVAVAAEPGAETPEGEEAGSAEEPAESDADDEPADDEPADDEPADDEPADEEPADEEPADEEPADEEPADEEGAEPEKESEGEPETEEESSWPAPTITGTELARELDALMQRNNIVFNMIEVPSAYQLNVRTEAQDEAEAERQHDLVRKYLGNKYGDALDAPDPRSTFIDKDTASKVKEIIDRRLYAYGKVKEPMIQTQGNRRLIVELPGIKDPEEALRIIGKTAVLEFRIVPQKVEPLQQVSGEPDYSVWRDTNKEPPVDVPVESVLHASPVRFTGADLKANSDVTSGQSNDYVVRFELKANQTQAFHKFTQQNVGRIMAIVLDNEVQMAPVIRSAIPGKGIIEGDMGVEEATELSLLLNAGALPVKIEIAENRTISATLGAASVRKSGIAGLVGLACVFLFMVFYYRVPGLLADAALIIYCLFVLGALAGLRTTLTLPGIAGIILSIGMAVDANVIIFERLKEELRTNKTLKSAVEAAFARAWTAILDGNVTTLIVALVLWWLGTSMIKSFAVTLFWGVLCSLLTAVTVTRWLCQWLVTTRIGQDRGLFGDVAEPEPAPAEAAATGR